MRYWLGIARGIGKVWDQFSVDTEALLPLFLFLRSFFHNISITYWKKSWKIKFSLQRYRDSPSMTAPVLGRLSFSKGVQCSANGATTQRPSLHTQRFTGKGECVSSVVPALTHAPKTRSIPPYPPKNPKKKTPLTTRSYGIDVICV